MDGTLASGSETNYPWSGKIKFERRNILGRGGYGTVYHGTFDGRPVAIKRIVIDDDPLNPTVEDREITAQMKLDHPNVVKMLTVEQDLDFRYIVLELCAGTLKQFIEETNYNGPKLPKDEIVLYQIARGLNYIHSEKLVHRDINPANILISDKAEMKIADFGLSKATNSQGSHSVSKVPGTKNWIPPDYVEKDGKIRTRGSVKSDIFAAGLVFFYFVTKGFHPFGEGGDIEENMNNNKPVNLLIKLPEDHFAYHLIAKMIKKVDERIGLDEVMKTLAHLTIEFTETRLFPEMSGRFEVRFHPTDAVLACGSGGQVTILKAANGSVPISNWRMANVFKGLGCIWALEWNVNGTQLAAVGFYGTVIAWSYPSGEILFQKEANMEVYVIIWNPFIQDVFATAAYKNTTYLLLWNTRSDKDSTKAKQFHTLECDGEIKKIEWISANQIALARLREPCIEIWQINEEGETTESRIDWIFGLKWNEATKYLASSSETGWIKIWSMDNDEPVHSLYFNSECLCLAWCPNGKMNNENVDAARKRKENLTFACGLMNRSIVIWNPLEKEETKRKRILPKKHSNIVLFLSYSPDGKFLASADENKIIIWSTETWTPVFTSKYREYGCQFSWLSLESSTNSSYKLAITSRNSSGGFLVIEC